VEGASRRADNLRMTMRTRILGPLVIALVAICTSGLRPAGGGEEPWRGLAKRIMSRSRPDSTAVLVLFDEDVVDSLRSRLPKSFKVVPFRHPDVPNNDAFGPPQLGQMFREASAATEARPELWVVGRTMGSTARTRAARFAEQAASQARRRVLRDSVKTPLGTVQISYWVDRPGGVAERVGIRESLAYAESVMARGIPKPTPITDPFTLSELKTDPDTLSLYVDRLADTTFYSIGGCSDVEIVFWNASERLGQLGPGVLPVLVERMTDHNPFVRERVQDALRHATQDERILARTNGEYLKFYDQPAGSSREIVAAWWTKFGHFWVPADSTR
jgi:hypothetical protein